jgi:hypothetical protein
LSLTFLSHVIEVDAGAFDRGGFGPAVGTTTGSTFPLGIRIANPTKPPLALGHASA